MKFLVSTRGIGDNATVDAFSRMADTFTAMLQEGPFADIPARAEFGANYFETDGDNRLFWFAGESHGWLQIHTDLSTGDPSLLHNRMTDLEGGGGGHWFHVPTPTEGGLLYGTDAPAWAVLAHPGGANSVLVSTAKQVAWTTSLTLTALTLSNMTEGSVLFAGPGGVVSQDNTKFFWHDGNNQLFLGVGDATKPPYSYVGRTEDGGFSPALGALGWAIATQEKMRLTATGLGIGCTPSYPLDVTGTAAVGRGVGEGGIALLFNLERAWAFQQLSYGASAALQLICLAVNKSFYIDTDGAIVFRTFAGVNAASLAHLTGVWWWLPTATALTLNGHLAQSSTFNTLVGRIGDTTTRFGGTVSNVASALGEFLSQTNLVHTMWSDTVDKDFWVTGKPINVFAICRYRLPAGDAGGDYTCTVEVLLGTEVLVERTIRHTLGAPVLSGYYYVELHSRVTKYTNNNLRLVSRAKQSAVVALASWVEGAKLTLTEYAEVRADPVVEDVTSANVTLQVRVTFSRSATGLRCVLMDAGWEAAG